MFNSDLWSEIVFHLDYHSILSLTLVSKQLNLFCSSDHLWKRMLERDFPYYHVQDQYKYHYLLIEQDEKQFWVLFQSLPSLSIPHVYKLITKSISTFHLIYNFYKTHFVTVITGLYQALPPKNVDIEKSAGYVMEDYSIFWIGQLTIQQKKVLEVYRKKDDYFIQLLIQGKDSYFQFPNNIEFLDLLRGIGAYATLINTVFRLG